MEYPKNLQDFFILCFLSQSSGNDAQVMMVTSPVVTMLAVAFS